MIIPVINGGLKGVFFSIDADTHYIGNSLSFIKMNQIQYTNHPATPSILLYAYLLTPLRLVSKFIYNTNFILWSVQHLDLIYFYLRIFQSIIFGGGIILLLASVYQITKSIKTIIFSYSALFSFQFFPYLGVCIRSETTSFVIISLWLIIFTRFIRFKSIKYIPLLSIVSALAVANKFTNIFYFIASISLVTTIAKIGIKKKLYLFFSQLIIGVMTFFVFTWPIRTKYYLVFNLVRDLFTHTDLMGYGKLAIFDLSSYTNSVISQVKQEFWASIIFIIVLITFIYRYFIRKYKIDPAITIAAGIISFGIFVFAKYPWSYYQTSNFLMVVFIGSIIFSRMPKFLSWLVIIFLTFITISNFRTYFYRISNFITQTTYLEKYITEHPAKIATIWEWGKAKDFALLWGNSWSGGSYSDELKKIRPDLLFDIDYYTKNTPHYNDKTGVFSVCWDKLYSRKDYAVDFIKKYPEYKLDYNEIPGTENMVVIESKHCMK